MTTLKDLKAQMLAKPAIAAEYAAQAAAFAAARESIAAHPIAEHARAEIEQRLAALEAEHGIRILYACESGSRAWGFASPDSDYDVRFIYAQPLAWYLQVSPQRDVIELPISAELDISGWELRKALALLKKGNATLVEWLDSPVVYRADAAFLAAMQSAAQQTHQPQRSFHHYLHMARKNYREHLQGETVRLKKYLYVLRPLLAALWLEQGRGLVPMRFEVLLDAMVTAPDLHATITQLLARKRQALEAERGAALPIINAFIEAELSRLEASPAPATTAPDWALLDQLLLQTVLQSAA